MRCIQNPLLFYIAGCRDVAGYFLRAAFQLMARETLQATSLRLHFGHAAGFALPGRPRACPERSRRAAVPTGAVTRSALVDCYIRAGIFWAEVFCPRADQAVVVELLDDMRGPATHTGDGEDGREQVHINAKRVIGGSRIEINVGIELLIGLHELFNLVRDLEPFGLSTRRAEIAGH